MIPNTCAEVFMAVIKNKPKDVIKLSQWTVYKFVSISVSFLIGVGALILCVCVVRVCAKKVQHQMRGFGLLEERRKERRRERGGMDRSGSAGFSRGALRSVPQIQKKQQMGGKDGMERCRGYGGRTKIDIRPSYKRDKKTFNTHRHTHKQSQHEGNPNCRLSYNISFSSPSFLSFCQISDECTKFNHLLPKIMPAG